MFMQNAFVQIRENELRNSLLSVRFDASPAVTWASVP
jgi:hypothetical protein